MTEKIIGVNEDDDDDQNDEDPKEENKNDDNDDNDDVDMTQDKDKDNEEDNEQDNDKEDKPQKKKGMIPKKSSKKGAKKGSSSKPKRKSRANDDKIAKARIYLSPNYGEKETLLLLIPGSGAVRAGQWARSICINDNLAAGCMYPFIAEAYKRDWGVVLFDPNGRTDTGRVYSGEHVTYVYDKWVESMYLSKKDCKIKNVLIVCHSAGGMATTSLLNDKTKYLLPRIRGVAGTDTFFGRAQNKQIQQVYKKYIVNWVTSSQPLGTILSSTVPKRVSAGHNSHEYTSASAFPQIVSYFDAMLKMHTMLNTSKEDTKATKTTKSSKKQPTINDEQDTETENKEDVNKDDGNNNKEQCDANDDPEIKDKDKDNAKSDDNKGTTETETEDKSKKDGNKMDVDNE